MSDNVLLGIILAVYFLLFVVLISSIFTVKERETNIKNKIVCSCNIENVS
jgi:hypothetical protein